MKKLTALLLALLLMLSLAACGGATPQKTDEEPQVVVVQEEAQSADGEDEPEQPQDEAEAEEPQKETNAEEITFTEAVAVDNDECSIKITGIEPNDLWGYTLQVQLENKSADKTYMFSTRGGSINGVECDPMFATEVAAGKKANDDIVFSVDDLKDNGVGDFTDIEIIFHVYDSEDWTAEAAADETIHIYPYGEEKAAKFVREAKDSDTILVDNEYVTAIVTGYDEDDIWGYTVKLYLANKTDKTVMFAVNEASINGFMADPFYATSVAPGNCAFSSMSWSDTTLEENNITDIEQIEFTLRAYDEDDWFDGDFADETITLEP